MSSWLQPASTTPVVSHTRHAHDLPLAVAANAPSTVAAACCLTTQQNTCSPDVAFTQAGTACALQFVELPYGGQFGPLPLQNSAGMDPLAGWHTVVFGWKESAGHSGLWPEQTSCTSQLPAKPLHIVAPCFREYLQITPVEFTRRQNADVLFAQVASGTPAAHGSG